LKKIEPAFAAFQGDEIADGIAAAKWCAEHNLYQQSYTILSETMTTFVVNKAIGKDGRDENDRTLVNQCKTIIKKDLPESDWRPPASDEKFNTQRMIAWMKPQQDLLEGLQNLSDTRNDLNHAGQNDKPGRPETIRKNLLGHLEKMERIFTRHNIAG
jgi:hypothetical protein